jgi:hypothetical protein
VLSEGKSVTITDVEFLEEILESREELMDAGDDKEKIAKISGMCMNSGRSYMMNSELILYDE